MLKTKNKTRAKRSPNRARSADDRGKTITRLTAEGRNADVVAALMRMNKNTLRARHALELERGREIARVEAQIAMAESEGLNVAEAEMKAAFFAGYGDPTWEKPAGYNLLQNETLAETKKKWAEWLRAHRKNDARDGED
jgi:hypothetical protein